MKIPPLDPQHQVCLLSVYLLAFWNISVVFEANSCLEVRIAYEYIMSVWNFICLQAQIECFTQEEENRNEAPARKIKQELQSVSKVIFFIRDQARHCTMFYITLQHVLYNHYQQHNFHINFKKFKANGTNYESCNPCLVFIKRF